MRPRKKGLTLSKDEARAYIYGMDYSRWRDRYQTEATDAQKANFEKAEKIAETGIAVR